MAKGSKKGNKKQQGSQKSQSYICLNMIVRDESKTIKECLNNVGHIIDAIAIVDTGSSDNTIKLINSWAGENKIPCSVITDRWIDDFEYSRNFALRHGENYIERLKESNKDYSLYQWYFMFMDADNRAYDFDGKSKIRLDKKLSADSYRIQMKSEHSMYDYTWLIRVNQEKKWKWDCPIHEYLTPELKDIWKPVIAKVDTGYMESNRKGARSQDPNRYIKDALIFEKALVKDPLHDRNLYYRAQSYSDAAHSVKDVLTKYKDDTSPEAQSIKELNEPLYEEYLKRSEMAFLYRASMKPFDKWKDEYTYLAWLEAGKMRLERKGYDLKTLGYFGSAFETRPTRLEAPYFILLYMVKAKLYRQGWSFAKDLVSIPYPEKDIIFVNRNIHHYFFYYEASICAYHSGNKAKFQELSKRVLNSAYTSDHIRNMVRKNLETLK